MPHWLSWASTSNPNPSFNLKNGSLFKPRGTGKRNAFSAHHCCIRLLIDCNISLHCALLHFPCLTPLAPHSSPPSPFEATLSPWGQSTIQTGQLQLQLQLQAPAPMPPFFPFHSQQTEEVCYRGPVEATSTGAKPGGAGLNGWAVRQAVLWWETQTRAGSDGDDMGSCQPHNKRRLPCHKYPKEGCECRRDKSLGKGRLGNMDFLFDLSSLSVQHT